MTGIQKTAVIFGAGKTGRGYAAHLAHLSGYQVVLVDSDAELIHHLNEKQTYLVEVLGNPDKNCTIRPIAAHHIADDGWLDYLSTADLALVSVFGNNLNVLAPSLAKGLAKRHADNPDKTLNVITFENYTDAAAYLQRLVVHELKDRSIQQDWLARKVGFSEAIVLRTCLNASENADRLTVRAQDLFHLPCNGETIVGDTIDLHGIELLNDFSNQLRRKIYTYNCINGVITYLGAAKGYQWLYEAANDSEITEVAKKAANESSQAQIKAFGFDATEQQEWVDSAFRKFSDANIPDPIDRNGDDPMRKLGRDDRLVGPARLAISVGILPTALLTGIDAALNYYDKKIEKRTSDLFKEQGVETVLIQVFGLTPDEPLFGILKERYK